MYHQLAIFLRRMFASRTAFSPGGDDPAVLCLDRASLGVGETQGEPKGIGDRKWIVERSQEPVSTWLDPLPNGWEIATDRNGPGPHSLQKAVRRPVSIGDRDTHLGSTKEGEYLARRALSRDNDLITQSVMFDGTAESHIMGGVDEYNTHAGIQLGRQQEQCFKQEFVAHVRTKAPCIHDNAVVRPHQVTKLWCQFAMFLGHERQVNAAPARQDSRWGRWPEPPGPGQVDVALAVGKQ